MPEAIVIRNYGGPEVLKLEDTQADFDTHEQVIFCQDASVGLFGIIAIHNTNLGPAAGGCRMYPYESEDAALKDVLRLSKGMSYKNAVAGLPLGGGKCIINYCHIKFSE